MAEENQRHFSIQRIYIKDVSFETPHSPQIFMEEWKPEVNINLGHQVNDLGEGNIEVVLTATVTTKIKDKTAFLAEVSQAGIFLFKQFPEQEMQAMLAVYCPNILFPYLREAVSDLVVKGSFPQFYLAPVNFEVMYAQQMQQAKKPN